MTLTDTQLVLLSAAAQRDDLLITPPRHLNGRAAHMALTALLRNGLAEELWVTPLQPQWRQDEDGRPLGLRATTLALSALGLNLDAAEPPSDARPATQTLQDGVETPPQPRTKQGLILTLLTRDEGATVGELMQATGWLPHTTRAALTRLRQTGVPLERSPGASGSTYKVRSVQQETLDGSCDHRILVDRAEG